MKSGSRKALLYVLPLVLVVSLVAVSGCGGGASKERVTVLGTGVGKASADEARVTVAVVTDAETVQQAVAPNNQKVQAVLAALKGLGLDDKSLKTETVEVYPEYSQPEFEGETEEIIGYSATNRIRVTTKKVDMAGQIIETALAAGANSVDTLEMVTTAKAAAQAAGLKEAINNARKKAEAAAAASGRKLGKVVSVLEETGYEPIGGAGAGDGEVPVTTGQNEFTVQVRVTFELK